MRERPAHRPILSGGEFAFRFEAEKARQVRRYCAAFALWRTCKNKRCHRERDRYGDPKACLTRALALVPHQTQWKTRQGILAATPENIGAPERAARQYMPRDFYAETTARAVAEYLARFKPKPRR